MASSSCAAVSTSPAIRPALLAPLRCAYRTAAFVTVISRPRSPALSTTRAVMTLVMLPMGRETLASWLQSRAPVLRSTSSPPRTCTGGTAAAGGDDVIPAAPSGGTTQAYDGAAEAAV